MSAHTVQASRSQSSTFLVGVVVLAVAAGALVSIAAFVLARYGPTGGSWSFRGNGALAAYALAPAFLAGGWTSIVLRHRGRRWLPLGAIAGLIGVALAAADAALLPLFGVSADQTVGPILLIALVAWTAVAPLLALTIRVGDAGRHSSLGMSAAAAFLWLAGVLVGLAGTGLLVPAGS